MPETTLPKNLHESENVQIGLHVNSADNQYDEFGLFNGHLIKPTKRFLPSITENKVATFLHGRGPKVTKVSIFRYEHKPTSIRLNIEDNENAYILNDPYFWPESIVCTRSRSKSS